MNLLRKLHAKWVLPLAVVALLIPLAIIQYQVLSYTKGIFAYPLDDAFIHMGIAKNLAFYHVWGTSQYEFVSASSSILYPPLLAIVFFITGAYIIIPFIINLIAGVIFLKVVQAWLAQQEINAWLQLLILVLLIFLTPLPIIISIGMEHTLQVLFFFLFVYNFSDWAAMNRNDKIQSWEISKKVFVFGVLLAMTRFESMFPIFVACCFLLYFKQFVLAIELGVVCMAPIIFFGIYSISQGNYFFPNSVLLKSSGIPLNMAGIETFLKKGIFQKLFYGLPSNSGVAVERLMIILPLTYLLFANPLKQEAKYRYTLAFLTLAAFLHLVFANTTWFYRYEAYLIASSMTIICILFIKYRKQLMRTKAIGTRLIAIFLILVLALPYVLRSKDAFGDFKGACLNIYDQNYQMGQFLHKYYDKTEIAINDLGCPSYFTSSKILDLWGLGNIEVADSKRNNYYIKPFLDSLIKKHKTRIAVVFDRLYPPQLLNEWRKVATWHIDKQVVAGDPNLCFYAVDTAWQLDLKTNLKQYEKYLPPDVTVYYH